MILASCCLLCCEAGRLQSCDAPAFALVLECMGHRWRRKTLRCQPNSLPTATVNVSASDANTHMVTCTHAGGITRFRLQVTHTHGWAAYLWRMKASASSQGEAGQSCVCALLTHTHLHSVFQFKLRKHTVKLIVALLLILSCGLKLLNHKQIHNREYW